eukprot:364355-Chlamydomonas_euryale.AAC.7
MGIPAFPPRRLRPRPGRLLHGGRRRRRGRLRFARLSGGVGAPVAATFARQPRRAVEDLAGGSSEAVGAAGGVAPGLRVALRVCRATGGAGGCPQRAAPACQQAHAQRALLVG